MRGVGNVSTVRRLRKLWLLHSFSILVLIEPFVANSHMDSLMHKLGFMGSFSSENKQILVFWRHGFVVNLVAQSDQYLHLQCSHQSISDSVFLTCVYAKSTRGERTGGIY